MAKTQFENYNSASSSTKLDNPLIQNLKNMTSSSNGKISEGSGSTHSSSSPHNNGRKSKVATSMRKFLEEDDDFDYLGNLTQKSSNTSRRKITSYRKTKGSPEEAMRSSKHRRPAPVPVPRSSRIKKQNKPKSTRRSSRDMYEGSLKDDKPRESAKTLMLSARKLLDKAARAASPGRMRQRSKSPGALTKRNGGQGSRSRSPQSGKSGNTENSDSPVKAKSKSRSKSPGRLKNRENEGDQPRSGRAKKRSESPGRLKKRSQSPGKMKKRSQSPGALRRPDRPRRKPSYGDGDQEGSTRRTGDRNGEDGRSKRRNVRSNSKGPLRRPERARSSDRTQTRREDIPPRPAPKTRSSDDLLEGSEGDAPLKKEDNYDDVNRYKVKRNKSMDAAMAHRARRDAQKVMEEEDDDRRTPRRAESMMLSREMGRRGKSNSLADLVQYREEEIHSTSYFASNHVLINRERMKRGLRPLSRNIAMDELARKSAEMMATSSGLQALPTTYVGNVLRGETIRSIHRSTMLQKQGRERANILNPYFQDFGVGTCKGEGGMLYMCQLFSERLQLALTDTATEGGED